MLGHSLSTFLTHDILSVHFSVGIDNIVIFCPPHNLITHLIKDRPFLQFLFLSTFSLNQQNASLHHKIFADIKFSPTTIIHQNRAEEQKSIPSAV